VVGFIDPAGVSFRRRGIIGARAYDGCLPHRVRSAPASMRLLASGVNLNLGMAWAVNRAWPALRGRWLYDGVADQVRHCHHPIRSRRWTFAPRPLAPLLLWSPRDWRADYLAIVTLGFSNPCASPAPMRSGWTNALGRIAGIRGHAKEH